MNSQTPSTSALLSTLLLSDHRVLRHVRAAPFGRPLTWTSLREPVYLAYQPWAARYPDHVFDTAWRRLPETDAKEVSPKEARAKEACAALTALQRLVDEFLECRHGAIHVRGARFGAWQQGVISRLSSLPVQAMAEVTLAADRHGRSGCVPGAEDEVRIWQRSTVPLLTPANTAIDEYIAREGLHETHLHLNGSTQAEICWLRALLRPREETRDFGRAWSAKQAGRFRDVVLQVDPDLTPVELFRRLRVAAKLRRWLTCFADDGLRRDAKLPQSWRELEDDDAPPAQLRCGPGAGHGDPDVAAELAWQVRLIRRLTACRSGVMSRMFHSYLLLQNQYYRLLVQGENQYGFDQFQKYTLTKLRDVTEATYQQRFCAMHGPGFHSVASYVEGRLAPKESLRDTYGLLHAVLHGYLGYLRGARVGQTGLSTRGSLSRLLVELDAFRPDHQRVLQLALVMHFIKTASSGRRPYRHYDLDRKLRRSCSALLAALRRWPRLSRWVRGIDAAANELDAPPEVFAPVFRLCRAAGLRHSTFHAGEDFRHLLSGIGYLWDALTLLELRQDDRIGHGTAMGISPELWLQRMPERILLSRGEWLVGLLAAWQLLREHPDMQNCLHRLRSELEQQAQQVFGRWHAAAEIEQGMALRGLCRKSLFRCHGDANAADADDVRGDWWQPEIGRVRDAMRRQPDATAMLRRWLGDPDVVARAEQIIETDAAFLDASQYVAVQQSLMRHVSERGVIIETLPSSNVRISQYSSFLEHHSLRWMRVPGYVRPGDPEIVVSLGSDDPGIFAGDLQTEFHQLHAALRAAGESESDALRRVAAINEHGRTYRFHDRSLVVTARGSR